MTTFEKIAIKIKKDLDLDLINFKRTRIGCWQKSSGAAIWIAQEKNYTSIDYGSCYTATELLKCKKLEIIHTKGGFVEIIPND